MLPPFLTRKPGEREDLLAVRQPFGFKGSRLNQKEGASLVAQWLRILLPMQGTRVRALVQEGPTCHGATKPLCYNY